ncbi:hypothetical protein [Caballeronia grimmiae]|uniref:hypothetical protein n=1 Tax=Caballeronia grimmiae TaxID=1071679 RepID=UPI0038B6D466
MTSAATIDGFNLLPYRSRNRRALRRQRLAILAVASLAGCAAVGGVAGWDAFERTRLDERRIALEATLRTSNAAIDEHARLLRTEAERRRARDAAQPLAGPRDRFLALLEALADAPPRTDVVCNAFPSGPMKSSLPRSPRIPRRRRAGSNGWRTCAACNRSKSWR